MKGVANQTKPRIRCCVSTAVLRVLDKKNPPDLEIRCIAIVAALSAAAADRGTETKMNTAVDKYDQYCKQALAGLATANRTDTSAAASLGTARARATYQQEGMMQSAVSRSTFREQREGGYKSLQAFARQDKLLDKLQREPQTVSLP